MSKDSTDRIDWQPEYRKAIQERDIARAELSRVKEDRDKYFAELVRSRESCEGLRAGMRSLAEQLQILRTTIIKHL